MKKNGSTEKPRKSRRPPTAESIAKLADTGRDVSVYFTNRGRMVQPSQSIAVEFPSDLLNEVDAAARTLHLSRRDAIKALIR